MKKSLLETEVLSKISRVHIIAYLLFLIVGIFVLVPQIDVFIDSASVLETANPVYALLALGMVSLTFVVAAVTYYTLAFHQLSYKRTVLVEMAAIFANRLLPSGVGSIGVNFLYLRKNKHQPAQAASVVAANNALGLVAHALVVGTLLLFSAEAFSASEAPELPKGSLAAIPVVIVLVCIVLAVAKKLRAKIAAGLRNFAEQVSTYRHRKARVGVALASSICLVLINVCSLLFAVMAVHGDISFVAALVVFSSGLVFGTVTPTPGGIGGAEAGLVGALVAYGVPISTAVAAAVLFRIFSYWFALIFGGIAFVFAERKKFI